MPDIPCIKNMVELMGESMSKSQAEDMLEEATKRTKALMQSEGMPEWAAASRVVSEMKQEQKMLGALKKRQVAQDTIARFSLRKIAIEGKGTYGKNIIKFLQKIEDDGNALANKHIAAFFSDLEDGKALDNWQSGDLELDMMRELEQLNFQTLGMENKVGFTGNKQAKAIADVFFKRRLSELQPLLNRWGANIEEAPGYIMLQTHSKDRLRAAGKGDGIKALFSKESRSKSFEKWRASLDGLNIDWNRTLAGEDRELFLTNFHKASYTNVHGGPLEQGPELQPFKRPGGSLADKLSSQRVLWFADAESAYKYNKMWGMASVQETMLTMIRSGAKSATMLMNLGTRPVDNVKAVQHDVLHSAELKNLDNAQENADSLKSSAIDGQLALLTGSANSTIRPWLTNTVDFLKNWVLATKGTGIVFSSFSDRAFMQSRLAFEVGSQLDALGVHLSGMFKGDKNLAKLYGVYSQSYASGVVRHHAEEIRPVLYSHKLAEWTMRFQGMNKLTEVNQGAMGRAIGTIMGMDAPHAWDALPARRKAIYEASGITPAEWDVIRSTKYDYDGDGLEIISSDKIRDVPDELIAKTLGDKKPTAANLKRARDLIQQKIDSYVYEAINQGVPTPTAQTRAIRTAGGLQRGDYTRELAELFFTFKGFPIKAAMTMAHQSSTIGGMKGMTHALHLVAQATIAGYISMVVKDAMKGRTPKQLMNDGIPNGPVLVEAMSRGGGLGIFGDLLLSDYDKRYRGALETIAGPALGEAANLVNLFGKTKKTAFGEDRTESLKYEAFRTLESNIPLIGMFPVKPVLEYLVLWQIRESLSPGVFRRTEKSVEKHNYQEYWVEPVR